MLSLYRYLACSTMWHQGCQGDLGPKLPIPLPKQMRAQKVPISYHTVMESLLQLFFWVETRKKRKKKKKPTYYTCVLFVLQFHQGFYNIITCSNNEITYVYTTYVIKCHCTDSLNRQWQKVLETNMTQQNTISGRLLEWMHHSPPEQVARDECNSLQVAVRVCVGYHTKDDLHHLVAILQIAVRKLVRFWFGLFSCPHLLSLLTSVLTSPPPSPACLLSSSLPASFLLRARRSVYNSRLMGRNGRDSWDFISH